MSWSRTVLIGVLVSLQFSGFAYAQASSADLIAYYHKAEAEIVSHLRTTEECFQRTGLNVAGTNYDLRRVAPAVLAANKAAAAGNVEEMGKNVTEARMQLMMAMTFLMLVFGEVMPKTYALHRSDSAAMAMRPSSRMRRKLA